MLTALVKNMARSGLWLAMGMAVWTAGVDAGCNCGGGSGAVAVGPSPILGMAPPMSLNGGGYALSPGQEYSGDLMGGPVTLPEMLSSVPVRTPEVAPPPGTLGQTYLRPTRPVPVDKHPRVSIIDVTAIGATQIKVYGTNEYRTKDGITGFQDRRNSNLWRFESEPLIPGVPHIYRVDAYFGETVQHRYVRLVPGRIVTLEF